MTSASAGPIATRRYDAASWRHASRAKRSDIGFRAEVRICAASFTLSGAGTSGPGFTMRAGSAYSMVS